MPLPFLLSLGLPALAGSGVLGAGALGTALGAASPALLSGIGAGLGTAIQTGSVEEGVKAGLLSGLGGAAVGKLFGGASGAIGEQIGQKGADIAAGKVAKPMLFDMAGKIGAEGVTEGALTAAQKGILGATLPGAGTAAMIGQTAADLASYKPPKEREKFEAPMPNPPKRTVTFRDPLEYGSSEQNYFEYELPETNYGYPYMNYAGGGIVSLAEGGEVEGMNEKDVILESILAIKGMKSEAEAQMILGKFLSEYGEDALRNLIDSVRSGEYDETVARFANGNKGMVEGPGDGSGEDDMVPATLDNQQDVLLTEGEFVIRKPTTDALTKEYGGGFLDRINEAEGDAPEVLRKMVG